ncbi:hypothetical protein MIZ03_1382 [Rhodoferax lithotrophicus]|uniref:Uncharacterized protein n=1 Tax=Rhodoferax lithotrophicus TaxID=2798804 RepID=A0ABM7MJS4_9BURK|nr:hypothetical protein MIZ03_1382 [Rhodoferax sp. MIZ03]
MFERACNGVLQRKALWLVRPSTPSRLCASSKLTLALTAAAI